MSKEYYSNCMVCGAEKSRSSSPRCPPCGRKQSSETRSFPEVKAKMSESIRAALQRPEVILKKSESARVAHARPDTKVKHKAALKLANESEEVKERRSASARISRARPEVKERFKAYNSRPEVKARRSETMKAICGSPEARIKNSLSHGGDGDLDRIDRKNRANDYVMKSARGQWALGVKARDENRCQHCGETRWLHAHHIKPRAMFPELELDLDNGVTLCKTCHRNEHRRMKAQKSPVLNCDQVPSR